MKKSDVLVIGAGIMGMASAYHIKAAHPDRDVLVIDRLTDAGQANTGRSNAMFRNTFTSTDNQVLSNASIDFYLHLQHDLHVDIGLDKVGYLWLMTEEQLSRAEPFLARMVKNEVELRTYTSRELGRMMPSLVTSPDSEAARLMSLPRVDAGVFGVKCGRLAPEKLIAYYKSEFEAMGGSVAFGLEAASLLIEPSSPLGLDGEPYVWQDHRVAGVRLTDGTELRAGTVVVACGAWNSALLDPSGIDGHSKAKKRQLFTVSTKRSRALDDLLNTKGFNESGTLPFVILPKASLFIKAVRESGEFWIGCEDEVNRPFISDPDPDIETYRAEPAYYEYNVRQVLNEYLPAFSEERPSRMWAGLYSYNTLDNLPYIFAQPGLIVMGGDSGSGIMKGDSLGRIAESVFAGGADSTATLYGGAQYRASRLGFEKRDVEREEWVL